MRLKSIVAAALLVLALAPAARAWGLVGHGAISQKAAEELGMTAEEQRWFALGGVMGDLDKSDLIRRMQSSPLMRFLATFGNAYQFASLVNQHEHAYIAALLEGCGRSGDRLLEAWALGVLSHERADKFIDRYADARYRLDVPIAEVACDTEIFRPAEGGRFKRLLADIEGEDEIVYSPRKSLPWTWWFYGRARSLRSGRDHDADVRRVDPFAQPMLDAWRAAHPGQTGGPRSVSDVWRQQAAFDAFTWNYRLKAPLYPGRAEFLRQKGQAWVAKMRAIALDETVDAIVAETRAWQAHLAALRANQPSTRPVIR